MENLMINPDQAMINTLVEIAKQAGEAILAVYNSDDFGVQTKDDESPLTKADLAAHKIIETQLQKHFPSIPRLSEESDDISFQQRQSWPQYFLIDPLDGTKEFIARNDEFTVNIALIKNGKSQAGAIYAPVLKTAYFAAENLGAYKQVDNNSAEKITVRNINKVNNKPHYTVVASRRHGFDKVETLCKNFASYDLTSKGSSLKMCLVAEGSADLYPRFALTSEWDTAAAQAIVEAAGGQLVTLDYKPMLYNQKESLLNPFFLVLGSAQHDWQNILTLPS